MVLYVLYVLQNLREASTFIKKHFIINSYFASKGKKAIGDYKMSICNKFTYSLIISSLVLLNGLFAGQNIRKIVATDLKEQNDAHLCFILPKYVPYRLSFNELPRIARKVNDSLFLKEIKTTEKAYLEKRKLGITKAEFLSCIHFINTLTDTTTSYWSKKETRLSHTIEYDPQADKFFIVLEGKGVYIGRGAKKVVTKALSYDGKYVRVVARADQTMAMERELGITKQFGGKPGLFKTVGFGQHEEKGVNHYTIYSALYSPGSLQEFFNRKYKLTVDEKINIAKSLSRGLSTLHRHKIVHRDLGIKNYLINIAKGKPGKRKIDARIADFGRAKKVELIVPTDRLQGNTTYMPPEGHHYSETNPVDHYKVDIFALGCVFYRLFYETKGAWQDTSYVKDPRPLNVRHKVHTERVIKATTKRRKALAAKQRLSKKERFEYLILRMLDTDPAARPTAKETYNTLQKLS